MVPSYLLDLYEFLDSLGIDFVISILHMAIVLNLAYYLLRRFVISERSYSSPSLDASPRPRRKVVVKSCSYCGTPANSIVCSQCGAPIKSHEVL